MSRPGSPASWLPVETSVAADWLWVGYLGVFQIGLAYVFMTAGVRRLYALEGESVKAIDCLEQAVDAGFGMRDWVEQDPDLGSLRTHPRYQTLLNRM